MLLFWRDVRPPSPTRPLRFLDAPGPALLRQNISWLRSEANPLPTHLERILQAAPARVLCAFDLETLPAALAACRSLARRGLAPAAVRGRLVPSTALEDFAELSFEQGLLPLLGQMELPLPERWLHPVVLAEAYHPLLARLRYGVIFSQLPEPGLLDFPDVGRAQLREGAPASALEQALEPHALPPLLDSLERAGGREVLLVDNGGAAEELARELLRRGRLGAWFGPARRPLPEEVRARGCPLYSWFEPEDFAPGWEERVPRVAAGCAFVPVGLPEEDIPSATARLLTLRELGYHALVPRAFVPLPNTGEWQRIEARYPPRVRDLKGLDGSCLPFSLPAYGAAEGPELFTLWRSDNHWPEPLPTSAAFRRRTVSFRDVRGALDAYLADAPGRVTDCHAHDVMAELLDALAPLEPGLTPLERYPFAAWQGRSLLEWVQEAIELRLRSLGDIPEPLVRTLQHAALAGGKRIRPILVLTIACAKGVSLRAAMPAALATEWIHTASLIQDDLPCMDDDTIRRRDVSAHVRHGEGLALLASDSLIALAFQDVAALAELPGVGPIRALELTRQLAHTLGAAGLVGGQVRDLLTRSARDLTLQDVLEVHRHKTAPLFRLTAGLASTLADLEAPLASQLEEMLASLGLAFQIIDDVLDATPDNESFGRPAGSDSRNQVPTFVTLLGIPAARRYADQLMAPYRGLSREQPGLFGLTRLARYVLERQQ